jgi:hypothetical protein
MVSGLAPGSWRCTAMVGKSTCGSGDDRQLDGRPTTPASATPSVEQRGGDRARG